MHNHDRIWLSLPQMCGKELEFVQEAFATNWISPAGPNINGFESELSQYLNNYSVAALSSGTAAIHLALIILGIQRHDEVICSSFTFAGSCNPVVYQGAKPVFVDSESDTWNMDPELLKAAITDRIVKTGKKPKAIILVHLYGMPSKIDEITAIANEYEIPVIEDAAEALGSVYKGRKCGTFGDFGILSFNGNKIITTSGGGALVSKNAKWIEKARFFATQARDAAPHYEHTEIGFNYRLSNVCAGIGRGQLTVLDERIKQRRAIYNAYQEKLNDIGIQFLHEPEGFFSNRWLTTVTFELEGRNDLVRHALEKENIESRPLWKPMHLQPVFKNCPSYLNGVSEDLFERGICLPSSTTLTEAELSRIVMSIRAIL